MNMSVFSPEEEKIIEMVVEEWLGEFRTIFRNNKKSDIDNFLFYAKNSFIHKNVFRYAKEVIDAHPNWDDWQEYIRKIYLKNCIYRRKSII